MSGSCNRTSLQGIVCNVIADNRDKTEISSRTKIYSISEQALLKHITFGRVRLTLKYSCKERASRNSELPNSTISLLRKSYNVV